MDKFTQLFAAKEKLQDSLQAIVQADLTKIEDFLSTRMFDVQESMPIPEKKRAEGKRRSISETKRMLARSEVLRTFYERKEKSLPSVHNLAAWQDIDIKLLDEATYSFGYLLYARGLIDHDYNDNKNFIANGVGTGIRPFLLSLDLTKPNTVKVIKGKVVDLNLVYNIDKWGGPHCYAYIAIKTEPARFKTALNSLKVKGDGVNVLLSNIYHNLVNDRPIPAFFTKKISFTNSVKPGTYMMPSGRIAYIPDVNDELQASKIEEIRDALSGKIESGEKGTIHLPRDVIFFPDAETNTLVCTTSQEQLNSYSISGLVPPDNKYKLHLLSKTLGFFMDTGSGGLSSYIPLLYSRDITDPMADLITKYGRDTEIGDVCEDAEFQKFIKVCLEYGNSRYGDIKLANWMTFMGILYTLKALKSGAARIKKEVNERKEKFKTRTPDDAPAIPNMRKDAIQFPHQANALAQLDIAVDSAVIDVGTGGGKAGIIIQDCLNLMNTGRIRKPLVVMPNSLVSQFLSEIAFFTDGQVNGFALTTNVENANDMEELANRVRTAPANTIFVTSYSWLSKGGAVDDYDLDGNIVKSYESTDWVKTNIGVDYVAVDESQNIKNMKSEAYKAVTAVSRGVQFKRIATGTLISNKPEDIVGQLMFLDPLLIGTKREFEKRYYVGGDPKKGPRADMAEEIRARLRSGSSYIMYREKDWAPLLPKKVYSFTRVEQTPEQAKVYKMMVSEVMDEIKKDPKLAKAWQDMQDEGDALDSIPTQLLGKLARLEIYLTAPDSSRLLQYANTDSVSPKVAAIDKLIDKSLAMDTKYNKVIVSVHYKAAARHLIAHSKHKDIAAYYDANQKDLIAQFQDPDSKLKVLFAVGQSIKEGLNLQIANRIVIADIDWTPGALKQLEARIFRPHVKIKDGKVVNLNEGKTVYLDTVIADDSADCAKYAFQSYKKVLNSIIMEGCPVDTPRRVPLSEEALSAKFSDPIINGNDLLDKLDQFNKWNQEEIDFALKKGDLKFRPVKHAKPLPGSEEMQVPWVKGMTLPAKDGEEPLLAYLDTLGVDTDDEDSEGDDEETVSTLDLTAYEGDLMGIRVRVEQGEGRIYSVRKGSVLVRLQNGTNVSAKPGLVLHKIGSVGKGLTRKDIRTGTTPEERMAERLRRQEERRPAARQPIDPSTMDGNSKDPGDIKKYLKSVGVDYARQEDKSSGENRCVLRYEGHELAIYTKYFKDLPLKNWIKYADLVVNGKDGKIDPYKDGKVSTDTALPPKKPAKAPKAEAVETKAPAKAPKTPKAPAADSNQWLTDSHEPNDIKNYLKSVGVGFARQQSKTTGENRCVLRYGGKELAVKTKFFKDLPLGDWMDFADRIRNGESGVVDPVKAAKTPKVKTGLNTSTEVPKVDKEVVKTPVKPPKAPSNIPAPAPTKEDALDSYLDDDFDFFEKDDKPAKASKKPVKVSVKMDKGGKATVAPEEGYGIPLQVASYNNIPALVAFGEAEGEALTDYDFTWSGKVWMYPVVNLQRTQKMLEKLTEEYNIPSDCMNALEKVLGEFKRGIFKTAFPEEGLKSFIMQNKRKARQGTLRMYPLVVGAELFFVVDVNTHPSVILTPFLFKKKPGYYIYMAPTQAALRTKFKDVTKAEAITDIETVKSNAMEHLKLRV